MESIIDPTNDGSLDQWKNLVEEHRCNKLLELAVNSPSSHLRYSHLSTDGLIFELWFKGVDIPPVLTFGSPYDDLFRSWCHQGEHALLGFIYEYRKKLYSALMDLATVHQNKLYVVDFYLNTINPTLRSEFNQAWIQLQLPLSQGKLLTQVQDILDHAPQDLDLVYLILSLLPSLSQILYQSKRQIAEKILFGEYK
jgi:hypothetical protein